MAKLIKSAFLWVCIAIEYFFISKDEKKFIKSDLSALCNFLEIDCNITTFVKCFIEHPEFRSVVYYRLRHRFRILPSLFFKPQQLLFINTPKVGGGLMFMHGFSTIIHAASIGEMCTVFQQVTIGYSNGKAPVVGNNCTICAGAKVIGGVTIGDNVTIGAGAVVVHDVPANSVVAGNPAKVISINQDRNSQFSIHDGKSL